jgi:hypothetical protein
VEVLTACNSVEVLTACNSLGKRSNNGLVTVFSQPGDERLNSVKQGITW